MVFTERMCVHSLRQQMLLFLLVQLATAFPATTSVPDTTPSPAANEKCTPLQQWCWSRGLAPSPDGAGCSELLTQGPCAQGEWLVLDGDAAAAPSTSARCAPRPCPDHQVLREGTCLPWEEARAALCGGDSLHLGPTGTPRCGVFLGWVEELSAFRMCSTTMTTPQPYTTAVAVPAHNCARYNNGSCVNDVVGPNSRVVIKSEDQ